MQVRIKQFNVDMEVKNRGIELQVDSPDGTTQLGDLIITKSGLTWCRGKTLRKNGKKKYWSNFIRFMENE